jgi:hypothetical protein
MELNMQSQRDVSGVGGRALPLTFQVLLIGGQAAGELVGWYESMAVDDGATEDMTVLRAS